MPKNYALCAFLGILPFWSITIAECFPNIRISECWWWKEKENVIWNSGRKSYLHFFFCSIAVVNIQNSQNSTPNSIFKKKCTIFVYFGIYLYIFFWFFVNVNQHYRFWQPSFRRSPNGGGCGKKNGNDTEDLAMAYIYFLTNLELLELVTSDGSSSKDQPKKHDF